MRLELNILHKIKSNKFMNKILSMRKKYVLRDNNKKSKTSRWFERGSMGIFD